MNRRHICTRLRHHRALQLEPFCAAHQNDEVLLVIHSPLVAAHFTLEMDRLWKGAKLGVTERLQRKLQENSRRCGSGMERESRQLGSQPQKAAGWANR